MDKKMRLILFGLIAISAISIMSVFTILSSREALKREYQSTKEALTKENENLTKKAEAALEEKRTAEGRLEQLKKEINKVLSEKQELQSKFDLLTKEREELIEKFKRAPSVAERGMPSVPGVSMPGTEDAYWAAVLKEKAGLEVTLERLKERLDKFLITEEESKKDKLALELDVRSLTKEKQDLERQYTYNEKIVDNLSSELVMEKNERRKLEGDLLALKKENLALSQQLRALSEEKFSLEKKLSEIGAGKRDAERQLSDLNTALEKKTSEIEQVKRQLEGISQDISAAPGTAGAKESVELPPIVVRSQEGAGERVVTERKERLGNVLAVNREHNFIVIDLGEDQNIKQGILFDVFREGRKIATVEVIQTRKSVSACDIKQQDTNIKVGDTVR